MNKARKIRCDEMRKEGKWGGRREGKTRRSPSTSPVLDPSVPTCRPSRVTPGSHDLPWAHGDGYLHAPYISLRDHNSPLYNQSQHSPETTFKERIPSDSEPSKVTGRTEASGRRLEIHVGPSPRGGFWGLGPSLPFLGERDGVWIPRWTQLWVPGSVGHSWRPTSPYFTADSFSESSWKGLWAVIRVGPRRLTLTDVRT